MSIGRTFPESLQKGLRSLEQGRLGLNCDPAEAQLARCRRRRRCWRTIAIADPRPDLPDRRAAAPRSVDRRHPRRVPDRPVVPRPDGDHHRGAGRARRRSGFDGMDPPSVAAGQAARVLATPSSPTCGASPSRGSRAPARRRRAADLQDRRHVRGRVRRRDAVPLLAPTRTRARSARPTSRRSSSSAPGRTGSGRASSSTTAACTPRSPSATQASRR